MKKPLKIALARICFITMLIVAAICAGVRINTTPSYPLGVYLLTDAPIEKGALVIFCPPDKPVFSMARERGYIGAGFCPDGYGYMIKKIAAIKGDKVEVSTQGVAVNGKLLSNSKPLDKDVEGRALFFSLTNIATLDDDAVLLMSDYNPQSFDARYFGLVDKSNVIAAVRPVWAW